MRCNSISIAMKVPVRPTPALKKMLLYYSAQIFEVGYTCNVQEGDCHAFAGDACRLACGMPVLLWHTLVLHGLATP